MCGDLKLFEREAEVLKQLNHARIPKYLEIILPLMTAAFGLF
jgi:serine/threonine protein kinase